jgi:ribulose-phosphate 3-epimerase
MFIVPKVSYSLLASYGKFPDLSEALRAVSTIGIDLIHYDVSEEAKTLSLTDVGHFRAFTNLPFDVHLCVKDPIPQAMAIEMNPCDYFCVHVENGLGIETLKSLREHLGCHFGLAINVETPVDSLEYAVDVIDYVLFMAAIPGVSGGAFNENVIDKIQDFKRRHPRVRIHVDGGINNYSAALLRGIGIHVLISGSYLLRDNDYSSQVGRLVGQNLNLPVNALMYVGEDLPSVAENATISEVARVLDARGIGCTTVLGPGGIFRGLITDTDIRRLVMVRADFRAVTARDIMNPTPYTTRPDVSLISLLRALEEKGLFFTVVPVVTADGTCAGILRLQDILFRNVLGLRVRHL